VLTLGRSEVLSPACAKWREVLDRVPHDVYHTPEYHRLQGFGQEGTPQAFVYEETDNAFLWPYLLTSIAGAEGYFDATSVYGYPGPVGSPDSEFIARAWQALSDHWKSQRVVSAFTRFNPLLNNSQLLMGIPDAQAGIRESGSTVSIDLTQPAETILRQYSKNLRYDVRKAREAGMATVLDEKWKHLDDFVSIYQETMARCGSRPEYLVDQSWVTEFKDTISPHARLFVTRIEETVAAVMIMIEYGSNLHCHLIGSAYTVAAYSPSKVLLDDVRIWGSQRGYSAMHLGGGLGGREDDLFQFKRKFSPVTHCFHTGRWVLDDSMYRGLTESTRKKLVAQGIELSDSDYFPAYRYTPATKVT
jgi:hypothetical protein